MHEARSHAICALVETIALYLAATPTRADPVVEVVERAFEGATISWRIDPSDNGTATVNSCAGCSGPVILAIDPSTRIGRHDGISAGPRPRRGRRLAATVYYLPTSRIVTRIVLDP